MNRYQRLKFQRVFLGDSIQPIAVSSSLTREWPYFWIYSFLWLLQPQKFILHIHSRILLLNAALILITLQLKVFTGDALLSGMTIIPGFPKSNQRTALPENLTCELLPQSCQNPMPSSSPFKIVIFPYPKIFSLTPLFLSLLFPLLNFFCSALKFPWAIFLPYYLTFYYWWGERVITFVFVSLTCPDRQYYSQTVLIKCWTSW